MDTTIIEQIIEMEQEIYDDVDKNILEGVKQGIKTAKILYGLYEAEKIVSDKIKVDKKKFFDENYKIINEYADDIEKFIGIYKRIMESDKCICENDNTQTIQEGIIGNIVGGVGTGIANIAVHTMIDLSYIAGTTGIVYALHKIKKQIDIEEFLHKYTEPIINKIIEKKCDKIYGINIKDIKNANNLSKKEKEKLKNKIFKNIECKIKAYKALHKVYEEEFKRFMKTTTYNFDDFKKKDYLNKLEIAREYHIKRQQYIMRRIAELTSRYERLKLDIAIEKAYGDD